MSIQLVSEYLNVGFIKPGTAVQTTDGKRYTVIQLNSDLYALLDTNTYRVSKPTLCNNVESFSSAIGNDIRPIGTQKYIEPGNVVYYDELAYLIIRNDRDKIGLIALNTCSACIHFDSDVCINRGATKEALLKYFSRYAYNQLKFCSLPEYMKMEDLK